jgi:hypothetical protein
MAKVTHGRSSEDTKAVGNRGMQMCERDQGIKKPGIQKGNPAINKVTLKILVPPSPLGLENNIFVAEKGISNG